MSHLTIEKSPKSETQLPNPERVMSGKTSLWNLPVCLNLLKISCPEFSITMKFFFFYLKSICDLSALRKLHFWDQFTNGMSFCTIPHLIACCVLLAFKFHTGLVNLAVLLLSMYRKEHRRVCITSFEIAFSQPDVGFLYG